MLADTSVAIQSELRDFPEWHHGREKYVIWLLRCEENEDIRKRFLSAREHIKEYLLEPYKRQPHITLFVCGFLVKDITYNDDILEEQIESQKEALEKSGIGKFEVEIGRMNSFASAPFLEVEDIENGIFQLRSILSKGAREFRTEPFRPHLTIGLYADQYSSKEILKRMKEYKREKIRWKVERVTLATYKTREVTGQLSYEYNYCLENG